MYYKDITPPLLTITRSPITTKYIHYKIYTTTNSSATASVNQTTADLGETEIPILRDNNSTPNT